MAILLTIVILSPLSFIGGSHQQQRAQQPSGTASDEFTHTVLCEYGTATWCNPCVYAHHALQNIYDSGDYPFYYVALVDDTNADAHKRLDRDLNLYGFPTCYYDGGYQVVLGGTTNETFYRTPIELCGQRSVPNITLNVTLEWLGTAVIRANVSLHNEDPDIYTGHLRGYIVEPVSRWKDAQGNRYDFGFLDWAYDDDIDLSAFETLNLSTVWDGNDHGYGNIGRNNIMVIIAVFNSEQHIGYSDPPENLHEFDAYYVDETAAARPPYAPDETPPILEVVKPKDHALYLFDTQRRELSRNMTIIIGRITIEVNASDEESDMDRVEFYIDGDLVANFTEEPYIWEWSTRAFFKHTIGIAAYDVIGNKAETELLVWKFF